MGTGTREGQEDPMTTTTKQRCNVCGKSKPFDQFDRKSAARDSGPIGVCKSCIAEQSRARRVLTNPAAWAEALRLAGGDATRLRVNPANPSEVVVTNHRRRTRTT
jgi:hypothetical protein